MIFIRMSDWCAGGKRAMHENMALNDLDGGGEGERVGIAVTHQGGLVHEVAQGEVGESQTVEFLPEEIDRPAAQHQALSGQADLDFMEGDLRFPPLMVQRGKLVRGSRLRIKDRRDTAVG